MMLATVDRRRLMGGASASLIALSIGGVTRYLAPDEARAADLPLTWLAATERACLDAMGDIMVPGSVVAGLSHYVDDQLCRAPADSLLFARYLDLEIPVAGFYRDGFAAVDRIARLTGGKPLAGLPTTQATALIRSLFAGTAPGWSPAAAGLFYSAVRNDAIDVVYGGPKGMERLGIPVMQHAPAPSAW